MTGFEGFPGQPEQTITLPSILFENLLPEIKSLVELKVTLHLMWLLSQRMGRPRCIEYAELLSNKELLKSLKVEDGPRPAEDCLREGLELAVARNSVLQVQLQRAKDIQTWYFLNTVASRDAVAHLRADGDASKLGPVFGPGPINQIRVLRPNIFALYEQNIGVLTPIIADRLRMAEEQYPASWIEEAVRMAVEYNKRNWRYVDAILKRWMADGKDAGLDQRHSHDETDPSGYFRSKYEHLYR